MDTVCSGSGPERRGVIGGLDVGDGVLETGGDVGGDGVPEAGGVDAGLSKVLEDTILHRARSNCSN
jgi:hypothetical protein